MRIVFFTTAQSLERCKGSRKAMGAVLAPPPPSGGWRFVLEPPGTNGSGKSPVLRVEGVVVGVTHVGHKEEPLLRELYPYRIVDVRFFFFGAVSLLPESSLLCRSSSMTSFFF